MSASPLLGPKDVAPAVVRRPDAAGDIVLVCEHASNRLPPSLGNLGLDAAALASHIAWDIGALAVSERLSDALDASLISQAYSRLAYDCNRPPESPAAIPEKSELYTVPGNAGLTASEKRGRAEAFYRPFHMALGDLLASRISAGRRPVLVTVHSFTPVYFHERRDGAFGILHDEDDRLAKMLLAVAKAEMGERARLNYPYDKADGVTHTLNRHATGCGIPNVMFEIRNDLIRDEAGQAEWAGFLERLLGAVVETGEGGERRHG